MSREADALVVHEAATSSARQLMAEVLLHNGGALPLVASLATTYSHGLHVGMALGVRHPGLAQRLLDALELEVLPTELARNAIATELEHYVEAMDR
jgi:hypothetical protein